MVFHGYFPCTVGECLLSRVLPWLLLQISRCPYRLVGTVWVIFFFLNKWRLADIVWKTSQWYSLSGLQCDVLIQNLQLNYPPPPWHSRERQLRGMKAINPPLFCLPRIPSQVKKWVLLPYLPNRNKTGGLITRWIKVRLIGITVFFLHCWINMYMCVCIYIYSPTPHST